ncbi:MAG: DUF4450 domain-containing protein [Candidatus Hydrogenedentes bacterium]|nr:DUF4450 domain-containing protein [Candidatus Hydrogenedentota bacterium]
MEFVWCAVQMMVLCGHSPLNSDRPGDEFNRYQPVPGGWRIQISPDAPVLTQGTPVLGGVLDDPRKHRRPLYPPAGRGLIWSAEQLEKIPRCSFRPLVLAYNEPRFLFDYHSAGGLLGHLFIGVTNGAASKWLHDWSEIEAVYVDGRMKYCLRDQEFPGVTVKLSAAALAKAVGVVVKVQVEGGLESDASLTWVYGGASGFFTNYAMTAPEFKFAPEQCVKDDLSWQGSRFALRRGFDKSDVILNEVFAAARYMPDWQAVIAGGSSWSGPVGFGDPSALAGIGQTGKSAPQDLVKTVEWCFGSEKKEARGRVAMQNVALGGGSRGGYIVVGMGGDIKKGIRRPRKAWYAALERNEEIAQRIVTRTPDPYLDAAVTMMAFANDGTWGDTAIVHGGWSWRFAYLGWRTWYGPNCYGWTERIKKSIQNHTTLGLVREGDDAGALGALLEYPPGVFYNMNEVFLDHVRHYFDYTADLDLMREIFPVLEGIVGWENRRLQPKNEFLYENALNTWISDSHWYIEGQCAQASAYMYRAHMFLADLARRLGKDGSSHFERAQNIHKAMRSKLWMPDQGVFAEYLDTRGNGLLHPEPELPTIYHAAEFGTADADQIRRMLHWADTHLRSESVPGGGKLVWSSNWYPNRGRSYTHSTYEMAYGENLNYALTNYLAGRADAGYALIRGSLCGIFNGPTPGGLACHSYVDGRQRANDEFADASSMWARAVIEGLFGIVPKRPDHVVELSPQFPDGWKHASIQTPHFGYSWNQDGGNVRIDWTSPIPAAVRLRLPLQAASVNKVLLDRKPVLAEIEPDVEGLRWVRVQTPVALKGRVEVQYTPATRLETTETLSQPPAPPDKVWTPPQVSDRDLKHWTLVDLTPVFNDSVTQVLQHVTERAVPPAMPASQVGFGYWKDHLLQYHGSRNQPISDAAWRTKVGSDGVAWTTDGIPFKTAKEGSNIGVVTLAGGFPTKLEFPVNASGTSLYLMLSGMTFPAQSHVVNLRVMLRYEDGQEETNDLVNPFTIGDCWSTWCGRFHDTAANGFENIGGRSGPAGSNEVADLTQPVELDTEAHLVAFDLRPGAQLQSVQIEAIANDVVFGMMGASVLR